MEAAGPSRRTKWFWIAVSGLCAAGCAGPVTAPSAISYPDNPAVYVFGQQVAPNVPSVEGGRPSSFTVTPPLPDGLVLDPVTGVISGTPMTGATSGIHVVEARNQAGGTTVGLWIEVRGVTIDQPCTPPVPDDAGACVYPATCLFPWPYSVNLDVATARLDFRFPLQFSNSLAFTGAPFVSGTNAATVERIEIVYPNAPLPATSYDTSFVVPAPGGAAPPLTLLPVGYFPTLRDWVGASTFLVALRVRAHGVVASRPFSTSWFEMLVNVCAGCMSEPTCPAGASFVGSCPPTAPGTNLPGQSSVSLCVGPP